MRAVGAAVRCLVCGGTDSNLMVAGLLRRCQSCGFCWTASPGAAPETVDLFDGSSTYGDYFGRAGQWRYEARKRLRWLLSTARPPSLLEAGPGGGFFLHEAQQAGIAVSGVEVSPTCVRFAKESMGLALRQGSFETLASDMAVHAVCAFHVLEHVDDPRRFLTAARTALWPGGWLVLEVPNIDSTAARRGGMSWGHLQVEVHRWHFAVPTLVNLVSQCGFAVVSCDTIPSSCYQRPRQWLHPLRAATRLRDWTGGKFTRWPGRGDLLRLIARLPEGSAAC